MFLTTFLILKRLSLKSVIFPDTDLLHFGPFPEIKTKSLSWSSLSHPLAFYYLNYKIYVLQQINYKFFCCEYLFHRIPQDSFGTLREMNHCKFPSNGIYFLESLLTWTKNFSSKSILELLFFILKIYSSEAVLLDNILGKQLLFLKVSSLPCKSLFSDFYSNAQISWEIFVWFSVIEGSRGLLIKKFFQTSTLLLNLYV